MSHGCLFEVLRVFQGSFKDVSRKFKDVTSKFQDVSRKFQECSKEVFRVFPEIFREISRVFQQSFKGIQVRSIKGRRANCPTIYLL